MGYKSFRTFFWTLWQTTKNIGIPKTRKDWSLFWSIFKKELVPREYIQEIRKEFAKAKTKPKPKQRKYIKLKYAILLTYIIGYAFTQMACIYYNMDWISTLIFMLMYAGIWLGTLSILWNIVRIARLMKRRKKKPIS